jgi:hypothetical protein
MSKEIAQEILKQLGSGKFVAMTGAKNFCSLDEQEGGLSFKLPKFSGIKINYVKIVLNASDLYEVTFGRIHGLKYTVISEHKGIYCDELKDMFEYHTGLRTHL